jgi:hypothetical protein
MYSSCALTLAKKYKLRSILACIKKFGLSLDCPHSDVKFHLCANQNLLTNKFKPNHHYNIRNLLDFRLFIKHTSWAKKENILRLDGLHTKFKSFYSTSVIQNNVQIDPYFITGFMDAEACFRIKVSKNSKRTVG